MHFCVINEQVDSCTYNDVQILFPEHSNFVGILKCETSVQNMNAFQTCPLIAKVVVICVNYNNT